MTRPTFLLLLLSACGSSTGVPEGHGWTCLSYDETTDDAALPAARSSCGRESAEECAARAREGEAMHAAGADHPRRSGFRCRASDRAWCVSFRDVPTPDATPGPMQSMCSETREDCEYHRNARFLPTGTGRRRFVDVSECVSYD